ncbi:MAG: O-antigen ligase family protein [Candidatus Hodarchaeota archaeon]
MLTAIFFLIITFIGFILALWKGPFWGLIIYANMYMNNPKFNWWGEYLPELRWSLISAGVLLASMIIHREKLSTHKLSISYCLFILYILSMLITNTIAVEPERAKLETHAILLYCIIIFLIVKTLAEFEQLRLFILVIIGFCAHLSLKSHFVGKYVHGRLEDIGPADAHASNELGIFLASILLLALPFVFKGKRYERVICLLSLPLIINTFILTKSRGAFVALAFSIFYAFFISANKKIKKYLLVAGICFIPVFLYLGHDESYFDRISTIWRADRSSDQAMAELSSGRTAIWKYGFDMLQDYPLGAGPGGFKELARFYIPEELLTIDPGEEYGSRSAHNSYLQTMVELGYLGICMYMIICFGTLYILYQCSKNIKQTGKQGTFIDLFIVALSMSVICTLFGGLFNSRFYYEFFWWQVAFVVVINSVVKQLYVSENQ